VTHVMVVPSDRTPTYSSVHHLLIRRRGPARDYTCACGAPALDWAYQGGDPDETADEAGYRAGMVFTPNLNAYDPLCRSCHRAKDDRGEAAANGRAAASKISESRLRRLAEDPDFAREVSGRSREIGKQSIQKVLSTRLTCECGLTANPANMNRHIESSGHDVAKDGDSKCPTHVM
jgi:hypothetical protein